MEDLNIHTTLSGTLSLEVRELYMHRCLQLAELGVGYVAPNPMVGAVLVCNDKIIGEGYHHRYGEAHAEPNAINSVKEVELLGQSTLYVSLEPCSHYGKTPPCADLIVSSGIPRVVIGTLDPNPKVAGKGVAKLRNAGVEVIVGVLEEECRELNKRFFIFQEQRRPYVLLKWAQTRDGFMDRVRTDVSEPPLQISNNITRQLTHKMRAENQSILVGANTVLLDNPSLTVRNWSGRSPVRIAIDRQRRIPDNFNLLDGSLQTIVFTEKDVENRPRIEFVKINFDSNSVETILTELYKRNIHSVLVEGGPTILNSFIDAGCWDEANIEIAPVRINEGVAAPFLQLQPVTYQNIEGHDWLFYKK
ncbi:diaminohydroxyphosphoribosylaminopyrimidine deaminase; 5-amino-6-(5-phosphoribosylamino)uracil reductase [Paludibacter propionicigenes WB4]|uniref:Riboflavin biosynthesis protein RibD n=1 Tax=Paludibacter propionicigenes (strain DSM 17365 / JCM 13257 / WB4) TaxID=694427 RepID=E4T470_PALPW|nr:bifunctional diaminohydroxyphosphoribosylaminopyrimidine deaminase/5-amino-6-(5-phosphoribosylamino)uracil reductase RibD [Paludibacter propionicigenes]ADQ79514.1 diaminohydroxyphosphoribosylaminopyrimidine deaminase; 5-amino-6-(5-phosphoribosylamino)uracil reductase [Paludibacter propionicigenes WB4]